MKKRLGFSAVVLLFLTSCYETTESSIKRTLKIPIYEYSTEQEAIDGLKQGAPTSLSQYGNIYIYNHYLLINERGKGIHIYDNSTPSNPTEISFMNIPGNFDMAIQNDVLYADSYDDLLSLDISDINNITLIERIDAVFPQSHPSNGIIIGYRDSVIEITEKTSSDFLGTGRNDDDVFLSSQELSSSSNTNTAPNVGTGGSFARFTITNNHLFAIDSRTLNVFDVSNFSDINKVSSTVIDRVAQIETVFPYDNHLFIGSTNGLVIYDITEPTNIVFESVFSHARACDPVYVSEDIAYVTLRSMTNNFCQGFVNQLDILDVKNVSTPNLIKSSPMINPHGVGVDNNLLFLCEGASGLKVFDIQKITSNNTLTDVNLSQRNWDRSIFAYDVIPNNGVIIVVGENELLQYDYSDPTNISFLSKIQ